MGIDFDVRDYLNTFNDICGITLPNKYQNNLSRLVALVDQTGNENPYQPLLDFKGGQKVVRDSMSQMPTASSLKKILQNKNMMGTSNPIP